MKLEVGKTYRTKDGVKVRVVGEMKGGSFACIMEHDREEETVEEYFAGGRFYQDGDESMFDLVEEVKPKKVAYLNVYSDDDALFYSHTSRVHADIGSHNGRSACIRVEYEDGQFDA